MEQSPTPAQSPAPTSTKMSGRTKAALWLMIAPTALFIATFMLYAIVNFIVATVTPEPTSGQLFSGGGTGTVVVNVLLFLAGVVSFITWLPGLIIGIVLLATKK